MTLFLVIFFSFLTIIVELHTIGMKYLHSSSQKSSITILHCVLAQWITGNVKKTLNYQLMMRSDDSIKRRSVTGFPQILCRSW